MVVEAVALAQLVSYGAVGLLRFIGGAGGIADSITVAPQHGKSPVGIGVGAAPAAQHADLLTVVDEGRAGSQNG